MTTVEVKPSVLQPGDPVVMDNHVMVIRAIDGPDHNETYDIYLTSDTGDCHKVVRETVRLVTSE